MFSIIDRTKSAGLLCFPLAILGMCVLLSAGGCKKLVDVPAPSTSLNQENVYAQDATSVAVLTNVYANMSQFNFMGDQGLSESLGLSADEFKLWNGISTTDPRYNYYTNSLFASPTGAAGSNFWQTFYGLIYNCNAAIEGLTASGSLTPSVKQQLLGEAKFMRSFYYFYLINLFGDVPLVTSTNWQTNATLSKTPKAQIYTQIISDLKDAESMLSGIYLDATLQPYSGVTPERVRPTKAAAQALLARVYLYAGGHSADAEAEAESVINNTTQFSLTDLNSTFLANSSEAIWQLQPVILDHNTEDAWVFIITDAGLNNDIPNPVYLNSNLLNSFEPGDQRRLNWVDSVIISTDTFYFPYKYKSATLGAPVTEYLMMLRLSEQYLIRAEARAAQGNISGATTDLNTVRTRAGLSGTTASDQPSMLKAILHERQMELFTELGHRWLDLKRTGNVDAVMSVVTPEKANGAPWNSYQQLYPILFQDIQTDPNLNQNPGY